MKALISTLSTVFVLALFSCNQDITNQLKENKEYLIKNKLYYNYIEDTIPVKIYTYLYDNERKLEKIYNYPGNRPEFAYGYILFEYSFNDELVNKYTYHYANDSIGWLLHDSTHYSSEYGRITQEETFYFTVSSDRVLYNYEYQNSNLIKIYKYANQHLDDYILYEYSGNLCMKESTYSDSLGYNLEQFILHYFIDSILTKSEKYTGDSNKIQIITYTYDNEGNLIIEEAEGTEFPVVKSMDYIIRYEYYEL